MWDGTILFISHVIPDSGMTVPKSNVKAPNVSKRGQNSF